MLGDALIFEYFILCIDVLIRLMKKYMKKIIYKKMHVQFYHNIHTLHFHHYSILDIFSVK